MIGARNDSVGLGVLSLLAVVAPACGSEHIRGVAGAPTSPMGASVNPPPTTPEPPASGVALARNDPPASSATASAPLGSPRAERDAELRSEPPVLPLPEYAAGPASARRVGDCVLPQSKGIPQALQGLKLDDRIPNDWMRNGVIQELCLTGEVRALVDTGERTTHLGAWQSCTRTAPSCSNLKPYADALSAAWGIPYRTTAGAHIFEAPDVQANLSVDIMEGESSVQVVITRVDGESICHDRDGFHQFQLTFMNAVEHSDRDTVARSFHFPFQDRAYAP